MWAPPDLQTAEGSACRPVWRVNRDQRRDTYGYVRFRLRCGTCEAEIDDASVGNDPGYRYWVIGACGDPSPQSLWDEHVASAATVAAAPSGGAPDAR